MILDFLHTCKTYDKKNYSKKHFRFTICPKCFAIGRFNLHGSYERHVIYFENFILVYALIAIKRIKCLSCKTTHAVMPCDLIPYGLLSLFVVIFILNSFYIKKMSVLKIAKDWKFSFQFIYTVLHAFSIHMNNILQYFREVSPISVPPSLDAPGILILIQKPYTQFQAGYIKLNRRPCFMCKFYNKGGAPPIGLLAAGLPPGGQ